ncbi:hypothetical protein C8Q70DRAFT_1049879 [Cubamyces menziesii]|nr:hypothetical protein C8Q70DRAFT_1049879 [Cubamyces menziesii]
MSTRPLRVVLAQHDSESIGTHKRKYAWHICVETGRDGIHTIATCFYLQGCPMRGYKVQVVEHTRYRSSHTFRGYIEVGWIKAGDFDHFAECVFAAVRYPRDDREEYPPQDWAEAALRKLHARGFLRALWTHEYITQALVPAFKAWEVGEQ